MPLHLNVSGTWKAPVVWINNAGTWKKCAVWLNVSGVWKQITALLSSLLPSSVGASAFTINPTNATATFTLSNAGTYTGTGGWSGTWRGGGASSEYEAYWTTTSGSLTSGTAGSWLNLGTSRSWSITQSTIGTKYTTGSLQIRMAASPNTVLSTTTVNMEATKDTDL